MDFRLMICAIIGHKWVQPTSKDDWPECDRCQMTPLYAIRTAKVLRGGMFASAYDKKDGTDAS